MSKTLRKAVLMSAMLPNSPTHGMLAARNEKTGLAAGRSVWTIWLATAQLRRCIAYQYSE